MEQPWSRALSVVSAKREPGGVRWISPHLDRNNKLTKAYVRRVHCSGDAVAAIRGIWTGSSDHSL